MKLILSLFVILASINVLAQEPIKPDKSKELPDGYLFLPKTESSITIPHVKKGKLIFIDGTVKNFTNLYSHSDSISFFDMNSSFSKLPLTSINQIIERKSDVGISTLTGGVAGFFAGLVAGGLIHPERTFWEFLSDEMDNNNDIKITKKQAPFVIGGTLAGAAIGALVGLSKKKEKTIYQKDISLNIYPGINDIFNRNTGMMLTCKITFNRN